MSRRLFAIFAAAAVLLLLVGTAVFILLGNRGDRFAQCDGSQVAGGAVGGDFSLIRQDGMRVTQADVIDGLTLIYFGYTYCPDICPVDVARNAEVVDLLDARGIEVTPVMITVDPERDTPEVMADFASYMHPRMIGLTGSVEEIEAVKAAYRVYGARAAEDADNPYYLVDHTTLSYLMAPGEGMLAFFRRDEAPEPVAERIACFANAL